MQNVLNLARNGKIYDLAQPYFPGMPHYPTHPPFLYSLSKMHGEYVTGDGISSASDAIALGTHVGTHMDALCHYSHKGRLHGGHPTENAQSYGAGQRNLSIDTVQPIVRRGVLLDIAGLEKVDALPVDFAITPERLGDAMRAERVRIERGDVVLLRTGWARYFDDPARFISEVRGPGPEVPGARWLSGQGIFAAGSDTVAFEKVPSSGNPVHLHLLVESGIHILEVLNLEELARDRVYEFLFIAAPLKIRGATGAPVRPLAIV